MLGEVPGGDEAGTPAWPAAVGGVTCLGSVVVLDIVTEVPVPARIDRRSVLSRSVLGGGVLLAGAGAVGATGCTAREPDGQRNPAPLNPRDWTSVRAQFALSDDLLHFAAFILSPHPAGVRAAIARHRAGLDADAEGYLHRLGGDGEQSVRAAAATYLGAARDEIALTDSTTMGLGLLYGGLRLGPGQEILTTEHDFYATHESLRLRAERTGATVHRVRLFDDPARASVEEIVQRLREAVRARTRIVAVTWVHSGTGVKLPIRAVADALAEINDGRDEQDRVLLCVDAVHGLGVEDVTVAELGCDFLVAGTHKWLFGPRGTGIIWGRRASWGAVTPIIPSFTGAGFAGWFAGRAPRGQAGELATPGGYHSFEHRWALAEAFDLHLKIGKARVAARTVGQAARLKDGLAGLSHVRLVTPRDPRLSSGIVCCAVTGREPQDIVGALRRRHGIAASVTPYREPYVRFGPSIVTTPDQVDQVVRAMAALR
jgi:selenocysteine lyase/cysteine desulfurase